MGAAGHTDLFVIWHQLDQMTRAFCDAFAAGLTCFLIYYCNTIYYMDGIKRTGLYAASKSHTSKSTVFCSTARDESHHLAVFHTCILILYSCFVTGSRTFHECNLTGSFFYFLSHDRTDLGCNRSTADRTLIYRSIAFSDCGSKSGTSRISTATAVVSRKNAKNGFFFFIYLYG